jgi:uncharacterized protein (TIGR01244 family)
MWRKLVFYFNLQPFFAVPWGNFAAYSLEISCPLGPPVQRRPLSAESYDPMTRVAYLTPSIAVAGVLTPEDFGLLATQGFKTIVNNRPDGEEAGQLTAQEETELARRAGVTYIYLPAATHEVLEGYFVDALDATMSSISGPLLLHCRSGLRSTIAWAAVAVRSGVALDKVLATAKSAGHDLGAVRDEIAEYADAPKAEAGCLDCQAAA